MKKVSCLTHAISLLYFYDDLPLGNLISNTRFHIFIYIYIKTKGRKSRCKREGFGDLNIKDYKLQASPSLNSKAAYTYKYIE